MTPCWRKSANTDIEAAAQKVMQLKKDPGNEAKLRLYALYKQVCCAAQPMYMYVYMVQYVSKKNLSLL